MRRITLWALSTLTTLVLLFSYHTSTSSQSVATLASVVAQANATPAPSATTDSSGSSSSSGSSGSGSSGSSSTATPKATTKATTQATTKTYAGSAVDTQYGPVQVQITVLNGKITEASVLQVPMNDGRDQMINSAAVPQLNAEVVQAQSATIDMVSGATFTSDGYIQSLQSAIDQAHL